MRAPSRCAPAALTALLVAGALAAPRHARAEPPADLRPAPVRLQRADDARPPLGLFPVSEDELIDPRMTHSWDVAPARWFLATTADVGFVYARPRVSFGHGKPFTQWVGIDANPVASRAGLGGYVGLRLELPVFDVRAGTRYFRAWEHTYLETKPRYSRLDLETSTGTVAQIHTYEIEADAAPPLGPGKVLLRGSVSYVDGVPEGQSVFEETLHVIVEPPLVWRARLGYALTFGDHDQHSLALVGDLLHVPKRDHSKTVRAGPLIRLGLSRRVEVRGSFVVSIISPDDIGLVGGDFTELGVRYRWATE